MADPPPSTAPVTVCVPTHNGAAHLDQCLDSVRAQSFTDLEILVVDDHSTDTSVDVARRHASEDRRVRLHVNPERLGLAANWNRCAALAGGEWVKFVFQDDWIGPGCVDRLLQAAGHRSLIACRRELVFESTPDDTVAEYRHQQQQRTLDALLPSATDVSAEAFADVVLDNFGFNVVGEPTAVLFHRRAFERYGRFLTDLVEACDLEYWMRVGTNEGLRYVPETLAWFRVHTGGTSAANRRERPFARAHLDRLLIWHQVAYQPMYGPLRARAARRSPPVDFVRGTAERALAVRTMARRAAATDGDPAPLELWRALVERYPRLERSREARWVRAKHAVRPLIPGRRR